MQGPPASIPRADPGQPNCAEDTSALKDPLGGFYHDGSFDGHLKLNLSDASKDLVEYLKGL